MMMMTVREYVKLFDDIELDCVHWLNENWMKVMTMMMKMMMMMKRFRCLIMESMDNLGTMDPMDELNKYYIVQTIGLDDKDFHE